MSNIRKNLMIGVDNRLTHETEVITLKTTSSDFIILEINSGINKMNIHPDDLQEALDLVKEFLKERPKQPKIEANFVSSNTIQQQVSEAPAIPSAFSPDFKIDNLDQSNGEFPKTLVKASLDLEEGIELSN